MALSVIARSCLFKALQFNQINGIHQSVVRHSVTKHKRILSGVPHMTRTYAQKAVKKNKTLEVHSNEVMLDGDSTVKKLSKMLKTSTGSIIDILKELGEDTSNGTSTVLDIGVAEFIVSEYGMTAVFPKADDIEDILPRKLDDHSERHVPRAPVVTIMGHVDHGKTTLLDTLRKTAVAQGEAGGITQHIGAFSVPVSSGRTITFIDTPGHAAFVTMRARGVMATDVVILVVAADDGVQQQTIECIEHARDANVPIVVAINKVDKSPERVEGVKKQLIQYGIHLEEFGGDTPSIQISALKGQNLDQLEEAVLVLADILELKADKTGMVQGVILESQTTKEKGQVATVLVQHGSLTKGKIIIAGSAFAKVRQLMDHRGQPVMEACPSDPIQVLGWRSLPSLGDTVLEVESEAKAKQIIKSRILKEYLKKVDVPSETGSGHYLYNKEDRPSQRGKRKLTPFRVLQRRRAASEDRTMESKKQNKLELIIKADVNGSLEAILKTISSFKSKDVELSVLHSGIGSISESDINLAACSNALVYGFNVVQSRDIIKLAEKSGIKIRKYDIIYEFLDDLKAELENMLPPLVDKTDIGEAQVLQVFHLTGSKKATIAGCRIKSGTMNREENIEFRVMRKKEILHEGQLKTLKHGKEDIDVAGEGKECGIGLSGFTDFKEGDIIKCVRVTRRKQLVDWK